MKPPISRAAFDIACVRGDADEIARYLRKRGPVDFENVFRWRLADWLSGQDPDFRLIFKRSRRGAPKNKFGDYDRAEIAKAFEAELLHQKPRWGAKSAAQRKVAKKFGISTKTAANARKRTKSGK